jgi:hypothetical protein
MELAGCSRQVSSSPQTTSLNRREILLAASVFSAATLFRSTSALRCSTSRSLSLRVQRQGSAASAGPPWSVGNGFPRGAYVHAMCAAHYTNRLTQL